MGKLQVKIRLAYGRRIVDLVGPPDAVAAVQALTGRQGLIDGDREALAILGVELEDVTPRPTL